MENMITDSSDVVYYVLKVNGMAVTPKYPNASLAEQQRSTLPENQQMLAELKTVTSDGKELLLG